MHTIPGDDRKMERKRPTESAAAFLMPAAEIRPYLVSVTLSALARVKRVLEGRHKAP